MNKSRINLFIFLAIFALAAFLRLYGVNWDQGQHLHPDERFLTMVASAVEWPKSFSNYFDTANSSLNPNNHGFDFFVYGTLPLFLVKFVAEILGRGDYQNLVLVGRAMSAFFDFGTVVLVFGIARKLTGGKKQLVPFLAMFFYAVTVLPIQLSHFFAVDTFLVFFLTLAFYSIINILETAENGALRWHDFLFNIFVFGTSFGLALACKVSAVLFLPVIVLGFFWIFQKLRSLSKVLVLALIFAFLAYAGFRFFNPYAFRNGNLFDPTINPKFIQSLQTLKSFDGKDTTFPPALQWIPTTPLVFSSLQSFLWGMGIPLGVIVLLIFFTAAKKTAIFLAKIVKKRERMIIGLQDKILILAVFWLTIVFFYQSIQFAKPLRYLAPLLPALAIIMSYGVVRFSNVWRGIFGRFWPWIIRLGFLAVLIWTFSFFTIYLKAHSRVLASEWIYQNIPAGSVLANEYWDDPLPLPITNRSQSYQTFQLPLYDSDTKEKWQMIIKNLETTDYIILTSNRLWRSISALPQKYPIASRYYQLLFSGQLGFEEVAVFTSYQCLLPRFFGSKTSLSKLDLHPLPISLVSTDYCFLALNDDGADESFTVYDHPKVIVFKKVKQMDYQKLLGF